jgi:UDP-3-O-[3-hydroxymyristoyl] N-acetylglucosamine deacetylase
MLVKVAFRRAKHFSLSMMDQIISSSAQQKTLKSRISCQGVGLHSGRRVTLVIAPAEINTGIRFKRTDGPAAGAILRASWDNVVDTQLCTTLGNGDGVVIGTIEHLMAAFSGLEIDNAMVEIDGPEVPIMDGSADAFVFLIECAGVVEQSTARKCIKILKRITVGDDRASATLAPAPFASFDFALDFPSVAIGRQEKSVRLTEGSFKRELSRARTFGFVEEVELLRKAGLIRGGSLDNAIVIGADQVLNREGLRYGDEFVRHKMLDAMGDIYLAGGPIIGRFSGSRSGHALNNHLLRALFADENAWMFVDDDTLPASWADTEIRQATA